MNSFYLFGFCNISDKNRQAFGEKMSRVAMLVNKSICGNLNAVMALNELFPGSKFDCVQQNSAKFFAPFVYTVTINNEVFKGSGDCLHFFNAYHRNDM